MNDTTTFLVETVSYDDDDIDEASAKRVLEERFLDDDSKENKEKRDKKEHKELRKNITVQSKSS